MATMLHQLAEEEIGALLSHTSKTQAYHQTNLDSSEVIPCGLATGWIDCPNCTFIRRCILSRFKILDHSDKNFGIFAYGSKGKEIFHLTCFSKEYLFAWHVRKSFSLHDFADYIKQLVSHYCSGYLDAERYLLVSIEMSAKKVEYARYVYIFNTQSLTIEQLVETLSPLWDSLHSAMVSVVSHYDTSYF